MLFLISMLFIKLEVILTHWKRPWCWEGLGAGGEGGDRGWDGWMASPTRWAWVWVDSRSWWWTGKPSVLWLMGSQRVGHDWATELNWTELILFIRKTNKRWSILLLKGRSKCFHKHSACQVNSFLQKSQGPLPKTWTWMTSTRKL